MPSSLNGTNIVTLSGTLDAGLPVTELLLPNGQTVQIETSILLSQMPAAVRADDSVSEADESTVIPLIEEHLVISKRTVETGKVRLIKKVTAYEEQLNEPLAVRTFDIERVIVNQPVDTVPDVRQSGDRTIYPVVEEQLVITKRLVLKEEIHVTLRDSERIDTQVVTLHREHIEVERESVAEMDRVKGDG